ncbi:MAG TPA: DoxX family protein [Stellaceae bacterium]|nr:DoxX family protein [Stellaceae bacterium]
MFEIKSWILLIARLGLASAFFNSGIRKVAGIERTVDNIAAHHLPYPLILAWAAAALELGGGAMLILGLRARWAAAAFFLYTGVLAVIFHAYWKLDGAQYTQQIAAFYEHLAIMGGMLYVTVFGPGPLSVDRGKG